MKFQIYFCTILYHAAKTKKLRKFPREKILNPPNTHEEKFGTHEMPARKNWGSTKYQQEKIYDPRNTHEKNSGLTKYPQEKIGDPRLPTKTQWHHGTRPTRPTIAHDPLNMSH